MIHDTDTQRHAASSAEPFQRPDHKAKKHPRPYGMKQRRDEVIGGGYFVFRRGKRTGRVGIKTTMPFEHGSAESAINEAARLHVETGEKFEVFARLAVPGTPPTEDAGQ